MLQQAANNIQDDLKKAVSRQSSLYYCCLVLMLIWPRTSTGTGPHYVCVWRKPGGKSEQFGSRLQLQIWGRIESKQCEDELDVIISFDQIFTAGASVAVLEDERLEGKKETDNCRQQVFHTLQQIDKSFQRPQKLCRFNQITGQNSEFSLSRNVPIQKF